jgi:glycosyltransferase involved in cell wall biosynthesis
MTTQPLISCIMPTRNRRAFVPRAIAYFMRQDYSRRELIVLDDGEDAVEDLMPRSKRIRYARLEHGLSLGTIRNRACELARGPLIAHWDDDDWSASWRLSYQAGALRTASADVCGLDNVYFFDQRAQQGWQYRYGRVARPWVSSNTLCYTRAFWTTNPFPNMSGGEGNYFVWSDMPKRIHVLDDPTFYVAMIHAANTSPKRTYDPRWRKVLLDEIKHLLGDDWAAYAPPATS